MLFQANLNRCCSMVRPAIIFELQSLGSYFVLFCFTFLQKHKSVFICVIRGFKKSEKVKRTKDGGSALSFAKGSFARVELLSAVAGFAIAGGVITYYESEAA